MLLVLSVVLSAVPPAGAAPRDDGKAAVTLEGPQRTRYLNDSEQDFGFKLRAAGGARRVTVRIDTGKLSGVAEVNELSKHCRRSGNERIECSYRARESGTAVQPFAIHAATGSKAGDRAKLTVTAQAGDDSEAAKRTTELVVGVPRFQVSGKFERERQEPGGTARLRLSVRASGPVRAENGVGLTLEPGDSMGLSRLYRNCGDTPDTHEVTLCRLDGRAPDPGETATVDRPINFRIPADILYTELDFRAYAIGAPGDPDLNPGGSYRERRKRWHDWHDGKSEAPALGLRPGKADGLGAFRKNVSTWIKVDNQLDVSALGTALRGREGETVEVPIRIRQRWPDGRRASPNYIEYSYRFTAPQGTTVVGVPEDSGVPMCSVRDHRRTVVCPGNMDGEQLQLRIDHKVPGAQGRVRIDHGHKFSAHDPDRANDTETFALHVTGVTNGLRARRIAADTVPWAVGGTVVLAAVGAVYWRSRRRAA
ncbi:COG1470 family protein [Streptomyces sp. 8N114]|uniref:COG1470 family protein n=1 Tax=Streptomyces sp. 8N114 TaxID=3457419 RepID=UPI003FD32EF5